MFSNQDSLWLRSLIKTFASARKVFPSMGAGVTLTSGSGTAWALGNFIEIIPANAITKRFRLDTANFAVFSTAATYEIVFYKGTTGNEVEIGRCRANPGTTSMPVHDKPLYTELLPANTRVTAKLANPSTSATTVVCSVTYHIDEE
jgi:hypothetical protein